LYFNYAADLSNEQEIQAFFQNLGNFDHLVYTAGEDISMSIVDNTDISKAKEFFTIRLWGALRPLNMGKITLTKAVAST